MTCIVGCIHNGKVFLAGDQLGSNGYYKEMLEIMKGFMQALKDNQCIKLAVITGCLKIAKESIFAGTNNFSRQKFLSGLRIVLKNGIERNL